MIITKYTGRKGAKKATSFVNGLLEQNGYTDVQVEQIEKREHRQALVLDYNTNSVHSFDLLAPLTFTYENTSCYLTDVYSKTTRNTIRSGNKAAQKALKMLKKLEGVL